VAFKVSLQGKFGNEICALFVPKLVPERAQLNFSYNSMTSGLFDITAYVQSIIVYELQLCLFKLPYGEV